MRLKEKIYNDKFLYFFTSLIIILGLFIRTKLLILNPSFWDDTCILGVNIDRAYLEFFKPLYTTNQVAPPFFMIISKFFYAIANHFIQSLAVKDFSLRFFSYICGIISLPLFALYIHRAFKNKYLTVFSLFIMSFNIYAVDYTIEFKQYSCELMFALILLNIFYTINLKDISLKRVFLYSLIIASAPWFAHFSLYIIASGFCMLFFEAIKDRKLYIKNLIILLMPAIISVVVFFIYYYLPVKHEFGNDMHDVWLDNFFTLKSFTSLFPEKIKQLLGLPLTLNNINFLIACFVSAVLLINFKNLRVSFLTLLPILMIIVSCFFQSFPFDVRFLLFLLPCFIVLFAHLITYINFNKQLSTVFILILLIYSSLFIAKDNKYYLVHYVKFRSYYEILKKENPNFDNLILCANPDISFYYVIDKKINEYDIYVYDSFNHSDFKDFITGLGGGTYWIYTLEGPLYYVDFVNDLQKYIENNKDIKIIKKYKDDELKRVFLMEIEKI